MSETLEKTIKQLRNSNIELEKDIEEKSRTDEMRKQFISDVSHELKTPIALIQGYAEGLVENITEDEASRKFYAEVILDEANKMDIVVKKLLELMRLEYGKNAFNLTRFNMSELICEVIKKSKKVLDDDEITVKFEDKEVYVIADEFYTEQVFNNYFTNAIKNISEIDGKKEIEISYEIRENKLRVKVFNTGENIESEDLIRIWNRFYKVDTSRNRENGGTGIGLSLVKAIMTNMNNKYGVENKVDGVEFYFELNCAI
ncbi:MAG: GHKL domain-containing protein [Clostridia bacterium]|jgi:two-component system sensor histidine kinase VanS|nr:GHKL domain-containing protein [Clostridia bacterium]